MGNNANFELPFKFQTGLLDNYNPAIAGKELKFQELLSAQPRRGRMVTPNQFASFQTGIEDGDSVSQFIIDFAHSFDPNTLESYIYAMGTTEGYYYQISGPSFVPFGTPWTYDSSTDPFASVSWDGFVYTTRENVYITKLDGSTATVIDSHWQPDSGNVGGKYSVVNNGHLFIGSTVENGTIYPTRIRWSDVNNPENWVVSPTTEADYFDLEPTSLQITGLTSQYGFINIYTPSVIYQGTYVGLPLIYQFAPLKTGIGNIYHYGLIQIKQVDFFIGYDNFYMLNGTILQAIGQPIWRQFQADNPNLQLTADIRAYHDPINTEVFWMVYPPVDNTAKEYVYNYQSREWSTRNAQNKHGYWFPWESVIAEDGVTTSTLVQPLGFVGTDQGDISERTDEYGVANPFQKAFYNGSGFPGLIQTFEFNLETLTGVKEVNGLKLLYSAMGAPVINLYIGTRPSQFASITWSSAVQQLTDGQFANECTWMFRNDAPCDKFFQFKFQWSNTNTDAILEFYGMSLLVKGPADKDVSR